MAKVDSQDPTALEAASQAAEEMEMEKVAEEAAAREKEREMLEETGLEEDIAFIRVMCLH